MNKAAFLEELRRRIAMLEDAEQQDILEEYAQHIDLRMESGLSEEDAIRDFGDLDQLANEILEAYHIRPNEAQPAEKRSTEAFSAAADTARGVCHRAGDGLSRLGRGLCGGFRELGRRMSVSFKKLRELLGRPFHRSKTETDSAAPRRSLSASLGGAVRWLGRFCLTLAGLAWDLFLFLCAACIVLVSLALLLFLGALVVMLFLGYPLSGPALMSLGGLLFCAGLLGLGWSLVWHRTKKEVPSYEND